MGADEGWFTSAEDARNKGIDFTEGVLEIQVSEFLREATIWAVDDEPANLLLLRRIFEREGVVRVETFSEAEPMLDRLGGEIPDLLLLDLHMPRLGGLEVLKRIPALVPEGEFLPVLVLTADATREAKEAALGLGAHDFLTKPFDPFEVVLRARNLLRTRALHLALREENARLESRVRERTRALEEAIAEVERSHEAALRTMGLVLEYRDYESKGHTDRVTALALSLGQAAGLDEEALTCLRWGGYLHDIGKVAIPDPILLKPGRLTPEEFEIMKSHVTIGEAMLRQLGFLPEATLEIVRHHHERWGGGGYPDDLRGEAIPLLARIFAIADVYDALTSERPYKKAWTRAQALAEISAQSGRQFDPELTRLFLQIMGA